jgi:hypothetical protein
LSPEEEAELEEEARRCQDSPTLMHLLKQLSVSKAPKAVSFKPPPNGPMISGRETFDLSHLQKAMWEARHQGGDMRRFQCFPIRLRGYPRVYEVFKGLCPLKFERN